MASNLDYLDPALLPLEEKVNAYLEAEKALSRIATDVNHSQSSENLKSELSRLEQEIIAMMPTRNEWLKVNLGYGPSRVGVWHVPAMGTTPERYELRVIH